MIVSLPRRLALAAVTLILAGLCFHAQVAAALIVRGDDAARNGDRAAAARYYRRALTIDASSATAADRLAFLLAMQRTPAAARAALTVTSTASRSGNLSADLFADRAWAEEVLHQWPAAQADFARASRAGNDPRYAHLAGRIALAHGRAAEARRLFTLALREDPRFDPARAALAALR